MWDDIKIGDGDTGITTISMFQINGNNLEYVSMSQNSVCYRISKCILDTGMTVMKNTEEGKKIAELIKLGDEQNLQDYFDSLILKHIKLEVLKNKITNACNESYKRGRKDMTSDFRAMLNI